MAPPQVGPNSPTIFHPNLTTHHTESLDTPTLSFTSDFLGLLILMAAFLSFQNSSRMVPFFSPDPTLILFYTSFRQPPPIHPRQIQAAAVAPPTFLCNRHCPCTRLPSCSQVHPSRPQRREPTRHRERPPQDHRLWFCPHSRTQQGGVPSPHLLWHGRIHVS